MFINILFMLVWTNAVLLNMDWVLLLSSESFITPTNIVAMMGFTGCGSSIKNKIEARLNKRYSLFSIYLSLTNFISPYNQFVLRRFHQVLHRICSSAINYWSSRFYKASQTFLSIPVEAMLQWRGWNTKICLKS